MLPIVQKMNAFVKDKMPCFGHLVRITRVIGIS